MPFPEIFLVLGMRFELSRDRLTLKFLFGRD
jgi:hypothetical protein